MELIKVEGHQINVDDQGFICLTDMAKAGKKESRPADLIKNWLGTAKTVEYLTAWEMLNNPNFKVVDLHHFKNPDKMSIDLWIEKTGAIGIYSRKGKYGGTYAHEDIAMDFGTSISALFRMYVFREYKRLKELENNIENVDWQLRRMLCKENYFIQTEAVRDYKIPFLAIKPDKWSLAYAEEGDIINIALFGFPAWKWRKYNTVLAGRGHNVRNYASVNELTIISTLEGMNAELMKINMPYGERLATLTRVAREQLEVLNRKEPMKSLKKATDGSFQAIYQEKERPMGMFPQLPLKEYLQLKSA